MSHDFHKDCKHDKTLLYAVRVGLFSDGTLWYGVPAHFFQVKKKIICNVYYKKALSQRHSKKIQGGGLIEFSRTFM